MLTEKRLEEKLKESNRFSTSKKINEEKITYLGDGNRKTKKILGSLICYLPLWIPSNSPFSSVTRNRSTVIPISTGTSRRLTIIRDAKQKVMEENEHKNLLREFNTLLFF